MFFRGIKYGSGTNFYGVTTIKRSNSGKIKIGRNCTFRSLSNANLIGINHRCILSASATNSQIIIGNNCGFSGTVLGSFKSIKIGNNVKCGANTLITDSDWHISDPRSGNCDEVIIDDNVWLGVNVVVLKGVSIGENSVIGANSVVVKSIPPNVVAAGNPCKIVKKLI